MARVVIPVVTAVSDAAAGVDLLASDIVADAGNDHSLSNPSGRVVFLVITAAASSVNVVVVSVADPYGRLGTDASQAVGASQIRVFGPFTPRLFSQQSGADLGLTYVNVDTVVGTVNLVALQVP